MRYVSVTETAKLVRKTLKKRFPNTKFSVRSSKYSGGASIYVNWTDGPTSSEVDAVLSPFESKGFDGMIDMAYSKTSYLLKDGTVVYGTSQGTTGSMGMAEGYENDLPEGAEEVSFGAGYIVTSRSHSPEAVKEALKKLVEKYGNQADIADKIDEAVKVSYDGSGYVDREIGDRNVFGEDRWDYYWSVQTQTYRVLEGKED